MNEIIQLPLQIQAVLVSGYISYNLSSRDFRAKDKLVDIWLQTLIWGLPVALITKFFSNYCDGKYLYWSYFSVVISPLLSFLWAKHGKDLINEYLRNQHISYKVDNGDVWNSLSTRKRVSVAQITVTLKNEKQYLCNDVSDFEDSPFASCVMGEDGIAFYVTHYKNQETKEWEEIKNVRHDSGDELTYFPKSDITMLEIRYYDESKNKLDT